MAAWTVRPRSKTLDQYWARYAAACSNGCLSSLQGLEDNGDVLLVLVEVEDEEVEDEEKEPLEDREEVEDEVVDEAEESESSPPVRWP